jgi:hypothetical protein
MDYDVNSDALDKAQSSYKDLYAKTYSVPREQLNNMSQEDLDALEKTLTERTRKVTFADIKPVNRPKPVTTTSKDVTLPTVEEVEPPVSIKTEEPSPVTTPLEKQKIQPQPPLDTDTLPPAQILSTTSDNSKEIKPPIEQNITIEQERQLRKEYPFFDFDKLPEDEEQVKRFETFKKDLLSQLNSRQNNISENIPVIAPSNEPATSNNMKPSADLNNILREDKQNAPITVEQERQLREEYPFFDFDKLPENVEEANTLQTLKRNLVTQLDEKKAQQATPLITLPTPITPVEAPVLQNNTIEPLQTIPETVNPSPVNNTPPTPIAKPTEEPMPPINEAEEYPAAEENINEIIANIAKQYPQQNAPVQEPVSPATSLSESALKSINENMTNMAKATTTSSKELKGSIDELKSIAGQILAYLPSIQPSNNLTVSQNREQQKSQPINTGLIESFRDEYRKQAGGGIIDLNNSRTTLPGFTI